MTQRAVSAAELAAVEHERLRSLISSMADGVVAVDDSIKVVLYNGAALNILDTNGSISGRLLHRLMPLIDKHGMQLDVNQLIRGIKTPTTSRDMAIRHTDGSITNLYMSIAPVRLGYGAAGDHGFVLLLRDITHEKSLEEEKDEFISVVSHELRTPIAIAEGNVSNVQFIVDKARQSSASIDESQCASITEALKTAHDQIVFLADMINDLSTLSRAERGKLTVEVTSINPHELVKEIAAGYADEARAKGLALTTNLSPHLESLATSPLYIKEILQNFITNALKYTEHGGINISAEPYDSGVLFKVADTGIGISKTDQEKVFDKFFRSEDFRTRATNGTGLGLYVTMKLARLIKADISLESQLNQGSTFRIYAPSISPPPAK